MDKTVVNIDVPNPFKERVRDIFEADPKIVDLYRLNPNFYEFGLHFAEMKHRDSDVVRELLIKVCLVHK